MDEHYQLSRGMKTGAYENEIMQRKCGIYLFKTLQSQTFVGQSHIMRQFYTTNQLLIRDIAKMRQTIIFTNHTTQLTKTRLDG